MTENCFGNYLFDFEFRKSVADSIHLEDYCSDSANLSVDFGINSYC